MFISEIYKSKQGEGLLTGTDSIFVRTSGCNLRCDFCDTPYTSWQPEGQHMTVSEIVQACQDLECSHVVLTGGEPMLPAEVVSLTNQLVGLGLHITIESAGTVDRPVACHLMSISPKLRNSTPPSSRSKRWSIRHETTRHRPQIISQLTQRYPFQLKFVVSQLQDTDEVLNYLQEFPHITADRVLLMPEGTDWASLESKHAWLEPFCQRHGFKLCPRLHIKWYGNKRGT